MNIKLFSIAVFTSLLLTACDGGDSVFGGSDEAVGDPPDEGSLVTVLPDGESIFTTVEQIESVLVNNSEIKEGQRVTFVLPQEESTLVLNSDVTVMGDLLVK